MVWTTPEARSSEHKKYHKFSRGGCLYCGWHCIDCPNDVATCKCIPKGFEPIPHDRFAHVFSDVCTLKWCRLHWWPSFGGHEPYPLNFNLKTSIHGWQNVVVYCGPGAYLPHRSNQ